MCSAIKFAKKNTRPLKQNLRLIIFSKDRAMQLEALFSSIAKNARCVINEIFVLYTTSDPQYQYSYDILIEDYPEITFVKETDFNQQLHELITSGQYRYVLFLTDDDIIFRPLGKYIARKMLHKDYENACVSLRLGLNINYCYSADKPNTIGIHSTHQEVISWDWKEQELDFGYPLSVTSHIFLKKDMCEIIDGLYFSNPNNFEAKIQTKRDIIKPGIAAYEHSCIVGIPANKVNTEYPNRNGLKYPYSTEELNDLFLQNKRINIDKMDFSNINAAQQEVKYVFE